MREAVLRTLALALLTAASGPVRADDKDFLPPQLPREQRENLLRFLQDHAKPESYLPRDAKIVGSGQAIPVVRTEAKPGQTIKQYMVQIASQRPVPGQEDVKRVDVYYYRPNPEKGKAGITVKHTVDLTTGKQVGQTEVLLNHHTPLSRDELTDAVAFAQEKSAAVKQLYADHDKEMVHWEYLQLLVSRKHAPHEPGDRVVRLVFTAPAADGQATTVRIPVVVNLTKGIVVPDAR
jgi:hypothetical protein